MTTTTAYDFRSAAAAAAGRHSWAATTTAGDTAVTTAAGNDVWLTIVHDAAAGSINGTVGSIGSPAPATAEHVATAHIGGADLLRILRGIVPATDTESSRYALGGTLVEIAEGSTLPIVATDGKRMHVGHVQPTYISGAGEAIVPAGQWETFHAAIRGCLKAAGVAPRKIDAAIARGSVTVHLHCHAATGGAVVILRWLSAEADGRLTVEALALAVAGRFPRWRDVVVDGGQRLAIDAPAVSAALADHLPRWRAAERQARDAWKAQREESRRTRRYCPTSFPGIRRDVMIHSAGIAGVAVTDWAAPVRASAVPVRLDHRFLTEALAGAAAWGGDVEVRTIDDTSPVAIECGVYGPRFAAVIMPMAGD